MSDSKKGKMVPEMVSAAEVEKLLGITRCEKESDHKFDSTGRCEKCASHRPPFVPAV